MNNVNFEKQKKEMKEKVEALKTIDNENLPNIIDCMEEYIEQNCYDIGHFDEYLEGCADELEAILGDKDVIKTIDLFDLYVEHFGIVQADGWNDFRTIGASILSCHINMIVEKLQK